MNRRTLASLACLALGTTLAIGHAPALAQGKTLKVVAHADLKILDPTFTPAYITRNFGYMVHDMPFGLDEKGQPKPQMVEKYTTSPDGKLWTFTLRPNLKFSDGNAVTSADVVASMQRWTSKDGIGRAMSAISSPEWKALDERTFTLSLKEPFGMVLEGMAKPSGFAPVVLPERLAKMPTTQPLTEVMGSGPYMFKRDEWVPGNKVVFVRNPHYVPRSEPSNNLAGGKKSSFDRVEWYYIPDANSAVAALQKGEMDLLEQVSPDYIAPLRADKNIRLLPTGTWQGWMVMNQLQPPFNNPKVRQAVLKAVDQDRFMAAMGYPKDLRTSCATFFICGGPYETFAGADPWRQPDVAKAKQLLAESGYKGEKVVLLVPSDIPILNAEALMAEQTMRSIGMNVDVQTSDWATIGARRTRKDATDAGGWSMYVTQAGSFDSDSPITNAYLSASCGTPLPGWPCDKPLDEMRTAWLKETNAAKRRDLLNKFHVRAFEALPYINVGQYSPVMAVRTTIRGGEKMSSGLPIFWALDK